LLPAALINIIIVIGLGIGYEIFSDMGVI